MPAPVVAVDRRVHRRLIAGVGTMLLLLLVFAFYTLRQMRQLRTLQEQVVRNSREDTLQLLRIQQDTYALSLAVRDMATSPEMATTQGQQSHVPLEFWGLQFRHLRIDLNQALKMERRLTPGGHRAEQREQLALVLQQFWSISDQVFQLARRGYPTQAQELAARELDPQRVAIHNLVRQWLRENDRSERAAEAQMRGIYGHVTRNLLLLTMLLFLLGSAVAVWAIRANRASFEEVRGLASQLEHHSRQLEALSWRLLNVQEETLKRVSRDLHDEFGQLMTALGAALARTEQRARAALNDLPAERAAIILDDIRQARSLAQDTQQKIRGLSQLLRPTILDDFGLEKTLQWYAGEFTRNTGIQTRFEQAGPIPFIPAETAIHLYRIAQEALTNVARHSQATEADVELVCAGEDLRLRIHDNGRGFTAAPALGRDGGRSVGLVSMRERAERLGGRIHFAPGPGGTVEVHVPLRALANAAVGAPDGDAAELNTGQHSGA